MPARTYGQHATATQLGRGFGFNGAMPLCDALDAA